MTAILPALAREGLIDAVDGFREGIASRRRNGTRLRGGARARAASEASRDQLSNLHGAALAARFGALSADHLEHTDEDGQRRGRAGTTAVILPGAYYFIRRPSRRRSRCFASMGSDGGPTDCNPRTSPMTSLLLAMNMARRCSG